MSARNRSSSVDSRSPKHKISVGVRIRPPPIELSARRILKGNEILRSDSTSAWKWVNKSLSYQPGPGETRPGGDYRGFEFSFSHIFPPHSTTLDVYESLGKPIVQTALEGCNGCIFAYGQTNSGKTHTICGNRSNPGIIAMVANQIFIEPNINKGRLSVSFLEVYNEQIKDLLRENSTPLALDETGEGPVVPGLSDVEVKCLDDVLNLLEMGQRRRMIGHNNVHEHSSRSHTIFRISLETKVGQNQRRLSHLNVVDLAGSELSTINTDSTLLERIVSQNDIGNRAALQLQKKTTVQREREGANIRKSLLALVRVVTALATHSSEYIPYRDSKLTRILQSSLSGSSATAIIATICPWSEDKETLATLRFAAMAQRVDSQPRRVSLTPTPTLSCSSDSDEFKSKYENLAKFMITPEYNPNQYVLRRRHSFGCLRDIQKIQYKDALLTSVEVLRDSIVHSQQTAIQTLKLEMKALRDEKNRAELRAASLQGELDCIHQELVCSTLQFETERTVLKERTQVSESNSQNWSQRYELLHNQYAELQRQADLDRSALITLRQQNSTRSHSIDGLKKETEGLMEIFKSVQMEKLQLEEICDNQRIKIEDLEIINQKLTSENREFHKEITSLKKEMKKVQSNKSSVQTNEDKLKEIQTEMEKYKQKCIQQQSEMENIQILLSNTRTQLQENSEWRRSQTERYTTLEADRDRLKSELMSAMAECSAFKTYYEEKKRSKPLSSLRQKLSGADKRTTSQPWMKYLPVEDSRGGLRVPMADITNNRMPNSQIRSRSVA